MPACPNNPRISPVVELWKGVTKYAGLAVIGLTPPSASSTTWWAGRTAVGPEDEENATRSPEGAT